jgi:chorismate mutase
MTKEHDQRILNLRNAIDTVDSRIIELLQERSSLAREIGQVGKSSQETGRRRKGTDGR